MYLRTLDCGVLCSLASSARKTSGSLTVERLHQVVPAPPNPDTKQTSAVLLISLSGAARRPCEKRITVSRGDNFLFKQVDHRKQEKPSNSLIWRLGKFSKKTSLKSVGQCTRSSEWWSGQFRSARCVLLENDDQENFSVLCYTAPNDFREH